VSAQDSLVAGENATAGAVPALRASYSGKVIAYLNKEILLKHGDGYLLVQIPEKNKDLTIGRGDEVVVSVKPKQNSLLRNDFEALEIQQTQKVATQDPPLGVRTIREALRASEVFSTSAKHRLIVTRGTVSKISPDAIEIRDSQESVTVTIPNEIPENLFHVGMDTIVIGEVKHSVEGLRVTASAKTIEPVLIRPLSSFMIPGEPGVPQTIESLMEQHPVGQLVKVRGRISLFLGESNATLLHEGERLVIVYRSDEYLSFDAPGGQEVDVVGIFDVETHREREYGVLRSARIAHALESQ
jgi:hypothetical protein